MQTVEQRVPASLSTSRAAPMLAALTVAVSVLVLAMPAAAFADYRDTVLGTPGLVSYWRLGETTGTAAADQKNANPGTYYGVTLGTAGQITGDFNKSAQFSSSSNGVRLEAPDTNSLDVSNAFSLEAWVKPSTLPTSNYNVIAKTDAYYLALTAANKWQVGFNSGGTWKTVSSGNGAAAGSRYHVVATYNGSALKLFVNGSEVASAAQSGGVTGNASSLKISTWDGWSGGFNGIIDEPAVYNAPLSPATVYRHYLTGNTRPNTPGVVSQVTWGDPAQPETATQMDREVGLMVEASVKWARLNVSWKGGEPTQGAYNGGYFANLDAAVQKVRNAGIQVVIMVDSVPCWASSDPSKNCGTNSWEAYYPPTSYANYGNFFAYVVNRYKNQGIHVWEVWNEPNHPRFWKPAPNASQYVQMLQAAAPAIRQADPLGMVVLGGLAGNDWTYLEQLYGGSVSPRMYFDALGVHPYSANVDPTLCWNQAGTTRKAKDAFCGLEEMRNVMVTYGDSGKEIWLTEFGWTTYQNDGSGNYYYGVSETQQADFITKAFNKLETYPWVRGSLLYQTRDWGSTSPYNAEAHYGLVRNDWNGATWSKKPSFDAFKTWATGH